ncbi:alpha/beta fold hydrolase [Rhodococcus sp. P1Y]|uniref:alpha/beta fold hydrolase n=1 Tax=Rhodococcus sp. P1Y TaxID=1302308 RepID=UPI000EB374F1|nr:alpha/beta hydrolase [Rhodococcus sp. P1Y]AYJ50935.1 alpha/beta hydrolase [Rhodococcus sp. P1Y]
MTDAHHPILFLSGAGLSPWIWKDVRAQVNADSAVGPRPSDCSGAPLAAYVELAVEAAPPGRFAIVAHSSGGVVGAEVARLVPDRVTGFLGIAAVIPAAGGSFVSAMPAPNRWAIATAMRLAGTRPPATAIRRGLGTGLSKDVVERIVAEFTPESLDLYRQKTGDHVWSGRRGFLVTTRDQQLSPGLQRRFAERLGGKWSQVIATGHLPMLQNPEATAAMIRGFLTA